MSFVLYLPIAVIAVLLGTTVIPFVFSNVILKKFFKHIADDFHLDFTQRSIFHKPRVSGVISNISVSVKKTYETVFGKSGENVIKIICSLRENLPFEFSIRNETAFTKIKQIISGKDYQTGYRKFDKQIKAEGSRKDIAAVLNSKACNLILHISHKTYSFIFTPKKIICSVKVSGTKAFTVINKLKSIIELFNLIREKTDIPASLISNIENDDNVRIRTNNLTVFIDKYPELLLKNDFYKKYVSHPHWNIKLKVLQNIGEKAAPVIKELYPGAPAKMKAELIIITGKLKLKEFKNMLLDKFSKTDNIEIKTAAVYALGEFGDTELNGFLCGLLTEKNIKLKRKAVKALKNCGTLDAVEELLKLKNESFSKLSLKTEISKTIKTIQERFGVEGTEGMLDIYEKSNEKGELSIIEEGSLSIDDS